MIHSKSIFDETNTISLSTISSQAAHDALYTDKKCISLLYKCIIIIASQTSIYTYRSSSTNGIRNILQYLLSLTIQNIQFIIMMYFSVSTMDFQIFTKDGCFCNYLYSRIIGQRNNKVRCNCNHICGFIICSDYLAFPLCFQLL